MIIERKNDVTTAYEEINGVPYRVSVLDENETKALEECFCMMVNMIKERIEDPTGEIRRVRNAYTMQWMDNITNQVADSNGEFVPSMKQVINRLKDDTTRDISQMPQRD